MRVQITMKLRISQYAVGIDPSGASPFHAAPIISINQIMPDPGGRRSTRIIPAQIRTASPLANRAVGSIAAIVK